MSQKRKRSGSSSCYRIALKKYRRVENEFDVYRHNGTHQRYHNNGLKHYNNVRYHKNNNRFSRSPPRYIKRIESDRKYFRDRTKYDSNRRNKRKYSKRHSKRYHRKSRSRSHSSRRCSRNSSNRSSRSNSSVSNISTSSSSSDGTQVQRSNSVPDDKNGHLICKEGDTILDRYVVQSVLGEGTFGRVLECIDVASGGRKIAMKVVRNVKRYRDAAKLEIKVLNTLKNSDPYGLSQCIHMHDWFQYHGHVCLTFNKFGDSVFEFLKKNDFQSFDVEQVGQISYQLCKSVLFMHKNKLTHTDLKPENILFHDSTADVLYNAQSKKKMLRVRSSRIELIDFGSATFDHEHHSSVVSTRHYRAPEVVLELGWSQPCDVWSIGCIIFELYTGNTLFQTHNNLEHMAMMQRILGPLPAHMIRKTRRNKYFQQGRLQWDDDSSAGKYVRQNCKTLHKYMKTDSEEDRLLFDLLSQMLEYDDRRRITLSQCLKHPYFKLICNPQYQQEPFNNYHHSDECTDSSGSSKGISKSNSFIAKGIYADYEGDCQKFPYEDIFDDRKFLFEGDGDIYHNTKGGYSYDDRYRTNGHDRFDKNLKKYKINEGIYHL